MDSKYYKIADKFFIAETFAYERERLSGYFFFSRFERCAEMVSSKFMRDLSFISLYIQEHVTSSTRFSKDTYASYDNFVRDRDLPREI